MIKNSFNSSLRFLYKNKLFSAVNFVGLLIGFIGSFYLASYIKDQSSPYEVASNISSGISSKIMVENSANVQPARVAELLQNVHPHSSGIGCRKTGDRSRMWEKGTRPKTDVRSGDILIYQIMKIQIT